MKVTKKIEKEIDRCYHECPYFEIDGDVMVCSHPNAPDSGYIISHPECLIGFPKNCPLVNANRMTRGSEPARLAICSTCGKPKEHNRHILYGNDLDNLVKHKFTEV